MLLEAVLRQVDDFAVTQDDVVRLANWDAKHPAPVELPFKPARVILQDFTGVPVRGRPGGHALRRWRGWAATRSGSIR